MKLTGAIEWITKNKTGWKYTTTTKAGVAVIELCEVSSIGWFLEIEIVINDPDDNLIAVAEQELHSILNSVGISRDCIEPRYYADLLRSIPG